MTKAERMIEENLKLVDAVCEVLDARIPYSSRNPDIERLSEGKPGIIVLNRIDLADPDATAEWKKHYSGKGYRVIECDAKSGRGVNEFVPAVKDVLKDKLDIYTAKGQVGRKLKVMILGIPNVGKSTLINKIAGRKAAIAGDKPGVTRGKQWIAIDSNLELLDTPGILWPRFDNQQVGEMLAVTNAINPDILDRETLGANFIVRLRDLYPDALTSRYKLEPDPEKNGFELLECYAQKRGFLVSKGEYDIERMAITLLNEYHDGKLGRLTLERPDF